ncbi:MAG: DUF6022 family protein [Chloroflexi bacterium]|nr:DUF6022 family protein [Chloroflexota bacterium]MCC6896543.1 hypothetical protein [Anaerolineae bacterium]
METLKAFLDKQPKRDIHALGAYVQQYVNEHWQTAFQANKAEMIEKYPIVGDSVYGMYAKRLLDDLHAQMKQLGLKATPRIPGNLMISREWGDDESDRQRWMWSKMTDADGSALGTIATAFYHNHIEIEVPRPLKVMALEETTPKAVIEALGKRSPDFANALDMRAEVAAWMASMEGQT